MSRPPILEPLHQRCDKAARQLEQLFSGSLMQLRENGFEKGDVAYDTSVRTVEMQFQAMQAIRSDAMKPFHNDGGRYKLHWPKLKEEMQVYTTSLEKAQTAIAGLVEPSTREEIGTAKDNFLTVLGELRRQTATPSIASVR